MASTRAKRGSHSKIIVRRAKLRDVDVLVHQRRAMWEALGINDQKAHDKADRTYGRWIQSRFRKKRLVAWLAENKEGTVAGGGCVWLQEVQPRPHRKGTLQPYLLSMYTEPEFRGRGVASMLVQAAIGWCRGRGYQRLQLHASKMGRGVYKRLGFKRTWEMRLDLKGQAKQLGRRKRQSNIRA